MQRKGGGVYLPAGIVLFLFWSYCNAKQNLAQFLYAVDPMIQKKFFLSFEHAVLVKIVVTFPPNIGQIIGDFTNNRELFKKFYAVQFFEFWPRIAYQVRAHASVCH